MSNNMNCILCGQSGEIKYTNKKDLMLRTPGSWTLKVCRHDTLLWVDEQATDEEFTAFYKNYPSHAQHTSGGGNWLSAAICDLTDFDMMQKFFSEKNTQKKVLDFGCGGGGFMLELKQRGFDVYGVEFEDSLNEKLGKQFGIDHIKNTQQVSEFQNNSFDFIILNHVIEHLPDPQQTLESLFPLLSNTGQLIIATPNIDGLGHRLFQSRWRGLEVPRHRFIFSPQSLKVLIERVGFSVVRIYFTARLSRGIFVSSIFPSLEVQEHKPTARYIVHFFGLLFAFFGTFLRYIGLGRYNEEMIFVVKK